MQTYEVEIIKTDYPYIHKRYADVLLDALDMRNEVLGDENTIKVSIFEVNRVLVDEEKGNYAAQGVGEGIRGVGLDDERSPEMILKAIRAILSHFLPSRRPPPHQEVQKAVRSHQWQRWNHMTARWEDVREDEVPESALALTKVVDLR